MDDAEKKALMDQMVADRGWILPEQKVLHRKGPRISRQAKRGV